MNVLALSGRLLLYILAGFILRKTRVMADGFDRMLSRFVMALPLPCMIVDSFQLDYSIDNLLAAPKLLALCVGSMAALGVLIWLSTARMRDPALRKTLRFSLLFTNFTFVGFAVVKELYGPEGFFRYVLFTLPIRLVFYGGASVLLGKGGERIDLRETLKRFFCEPVVAVVIGFVLYAFQIHLPEVLSSAIATLGNMASPLGLILCGAILADGDFKSAIRRPIVLLGTLCRLVLVPALALGLFLLLGVEKESLGPAVMFFAMPVASLTPAFLLRYDPEAVEARTVSGYLVTVSTLLCAATIPLWAILLEKLGGG